MDYKKAFALLKLPTNSSLDDVEKAYKKLAPESHPDNGGKDEEMTLLNEARDFLREYFAGTNLPTIIKQFEVAVRDMNAIAINQRNIERKVEKVTEDVRRTATNKLKQWRQMAIGFAAISAVAFFLGKDIPKDLISSFQITEVAIPAKVDEPLRPEIFNKYEAMKSNSISQKSSKNPIEELFTKEEEEISTSYLEEMKNYRIYEDELSHATWINRKIKKRNRMYTLTWYALTFGLGMYAALFTWYYNRRIQRVELELTEFNDELLTRSAYFVLLKDIFSDEIPSTWTQKEIENIISTWQPKNKSWKIIHRAVGAKKFVQLVLVKGQEIGFLTIAEGQEKNNYKEIYSVAESSNI